ncbi:hypothetical protein PM082_009489 [Marasmius tenuissimus]|nr:hypothetical protein PM082_009489 [Marasmius tenuissimus]
MRRPILGFLSIILFATLFPRSTRAQVSFNDSELPSTIILSQPVTVGWSRKGFTEPLQFQLLYLDSTSHATFTQTLTTGELGHTDENGNTQGMLAFTAIAVGNVQLEAIKTSPSGSPTTTYTALTDTTIRIAVASITKSTPSSSSFPISDPATNPESPTASINVTSPEITPLTAQSPSTTTQLTTPFSETKASISPMSNPSDPQMSAANNGGGLANNGSLGIIVGSIMGALAFIVLLILLLICLRRRGRKRHHEVFRRDMMVLEKLDSNGGTGTPRREKSLGEFEKGNNCEFDPISSITPLHDDFGRELDYRSTIAGSVYSRLSADTRTLAPSGISGVSTAYTEGASDIPKVPPLMPIAGIPTPSLPHFQVPFRAKTDRQMQIEQRIIELQGRFIAASGSEEEKGRTRAELKDKIERVQQLRESQWAYGGKGEVPDVLID